MLPIGRTLGFCLKLNGLSANALGLNDSIGSLNEGCFLTSAPSFPPQIQWTDVLIQQGHREDIIMAVVLILRKPRCSKKIQHPARWPAALWRAGRPLPNNESKAGTSIVPPKTNVAIGQEHLAIRSAMPFAGE